MSWWTYINGIIKVEPLGRTQPEKRYILETVLSHLPKVTGSERDMSVYINQLDGHNFSSNADEFGQFSNLGNAPYWRGGRASFETQDTYLITVNASLRDREFDRTLKEFQNWLCRLSKRVTVEDVLVKIEDRCKDIIIQNTNETYTNMFEDCSWINNTGEPNWSEYLMWERAKDSRFPMLLQYKYVNDPENDKEVERRLNY